MRARCNFGGQPAGRAPGVTRQRRALPSTSLFRSTLFSPALSLARCHAGGLGRAPGLQTVLQRRRGVLRPALRALHPPPATPPSLRLRFCRSGPARRVHGGGRGVHPAHHAGAVTRSATRLVSVSNSRRPPVLAWSCWSACVPCTLRQPSLVREKSASPFIPPHRGACSTCA